MSDHITDEMIDAFWSVLPVRVRDEPPFDSVVVGAGLAAALDAMPTVDTYEVALGRVDGPEVGRAWACGDGQQQDIVDRDECEEVRCLGPHYVLHVGKQVQP